jgi:hypothetical protein
MPGLDPGIQSSGAIGSACEPVDAHHWVAGTCLREAKLHFGEGRQARQ